MDNKDYTWGVDLIVGKHLLRTTRHTSLALLQENLGSLFLEKPGGERVEPNPKNGLLPTSFPDGTYVPLRFHGELSKVSRPTRR